MKAAAKKIWSLAWRVAVAVLLLAWIFNAIFAKEAREVLERQGQVWDQLSRSDQWHAAWTHGPKELWQTIHHVPKINLLLSLVFVGVTIAIGVVRWRMVLKVQGLDLSFRRAGKISLVAQFFNSFLLGATGGDLLKAYYAARETHHKKTEAVTTVFVDRAIGLASMLLFGCLLMLPNIPLIKSHEKLAALCGVIALMTVGCFAVMTVAFWGGITNVWPSARRYMRKLPMGANIERSLDSCRHFGRDRGFLVKALLLSMAVNAACVLQVAVLASGMKANVSVLALGLLVPMITCISALPITPSGLGVRENLFVMMLAAPAINVPATQALSLSLLAFAGSLGWSVVGGLVYVSLREREHLVEVTQETDSPEAA